MGTSEAALKAWWKLWQEAGCTRPGEWSAVSAAWDTAFAAGVAAERARCVRLGKSFVLSARGWADPYDAVVELAALIESGGDVGDRIIPAPPLHPPPAVAPEGPEP